MTVRVRAANVNGPALRTVGEAGFGGGMGINPLPIGPVPHNLTSSQVYSGGFSGYPFGPNQNLWNGWWGGWGGGWPYWQAPYVWTTPAYAPSRPATPQEAFGQSNLSPAQARAYCDRVFGPFCNQSENTASPYCRTYTGWCLAAWS